MLEHALEYASRGWPVFPCKRDKTPLCVNGVYAATTNPETIRGWWAQHPEANIGFHAGAADMMVIDLDPGHDPAVISDFPYTQLRQRTPRGGEHLFYALASGERVAPSASKIAPHVDVRSDASYVLLAPSETDDGSYTWQHITWPYPKPAYRSDLMVKLAGERKVAAAGHKDLPPFVRLDDPENAARFVAWLAEAKVGVSGVDRNNTLAATSAMGASYALSWGMTMELMLEHWNPRCEPVWPDHELEYHGGSGYRSATSQFGNLAKLSHDMMFSPQPGEEGWGPPVLSARHIAGKPAPARVWALGSDADGWLPAGDLTLLYGPGGSGKTALVGQLCLAHARGEPLFGSIPARQMPALFIACEDEDHELHRRFEKQGIRTDDQVQFASFVGHDTALHPPLKLGKGQEDTPFYQFLDHHLAKMGDGHKLLVLDNLGQIYDGDYLDTPQIRTFLNLYCRRLLKKHNATGLLLAHPSDNQKVNGDGGFGSVAWSAGVRSRLYFDWVRDTKGKPMSDTRLLSRKKANYSHVHKPGEGIHLDWHDWRFIPAGKPVPAPAPKAAAEPSPDITRELVKRELIVMLSAFPGRVWDSLRKVSEELAHRMGGKGHEGCSAEWLRKGHLPAIRDAGFEHYQNGRWMFKP